MKKIVFFLLICFFSASLLLLARSAQASTLNDPTLQERSRSHILDESFFTDLNLLKINNKQVLGLSAVFRRAASLRDRLKGSYSPNERIQFTLDNPDNDPLRATVVSANNEETPISVKQTTVDGVTTVSFNSVKQMKPGKYKIRMTSSNGTKIEQDFMWGVLAINTNKSVYAPNEKAKIEMAVLNENGGMVCDANVTLKITKVDSQKETVLTTKNKDIVINPQCYSHEFTVKPDYETTYQTGDVGEYTMNLTAVTGNGTFSITDSFQVRENVPFDVERITTTRIYPPLTYPVKFTIKANTDFDGIVKESVPENFTVTSFATNSAITDKVLAAHGSNTTDNQSDTLTPSPTIEPSPTPLVTTESTNAIKESTQAAVTITPPIEVKPVPSSNNAGDTKAPHLRYPFNGNYPRTQGFGIMPDDQFLTLKYKQYGVVGHDGMDFGLPWGTPVVAADRGIVIFAGPGDYGNTIIIQHDWGRTYYGHLSRVEVHIAQEVNAGDEIGLSGNTGLSSGPHLHFGVRPNVFDITNGYFGKADPSIYFNGIPQTTEEGVTIKSPDFASPPQKGVHEISIPVHIKKGETLTLEYQYQAPQVSPQFYVLGPLQFVRENGSVAFAESRKWQIASDAVWLSSSWKYRKKITIDNTKVSDTGASNYSNFPVLINLSSDAQLSANAQSNAFDLVFTTSDGSTKIPAEIESYTSGTGALVAWVNIPTLSYNVDTVIYMYYGNPSSCDQTRSTCTSIDGTKNENTTWTNANYVGVWHFDEVPSTAPVDITGNGFTLTYNGTWGSGQSVTGKIRTGLSFNGTDDFLSSSDSNLLDPATEMTVSIWGKWIQTPTTKGSDALILKHDYPWDGTSDYSYRLYGTNGDDFLNWNWQNSGGTDYYVGQSGTTLSTSAFQYYTWTKVSNTGTIYMNGASETAGPFTATGTLKNASNGLLIGADAGPNNFSNAIFDEVRIASVGRSAGWIATEYQNQNSPSTFYSLGTQECINPPTMDLVMRHGKYFSACGKQAFSW